MSTLFPFGFPFPTGFYLVFYVATLVIHVVFMNYVLAGAGYLLFASVFQRDGRNRPAALLLRDWLPFVLSAAITAGVAPLLFVQILYQHRFYTANLLGFHRWMAILPVLIVAFYLLYIVKSPRFSGQNRPLRVAVAAITWLCFAFVAYSWTENHLLSVQNQTVWSRTYLEGTIFYRHPQLLPRLGMWFIGAFPTMAVMLAWQMRHLQLRASPGVPAGPNSPPIPVDSDVRGLAITALAGMAATVACGAWYYRVLDSDVRELFFGRLAGPYFAAAVAGILLQASGWGVQALRSRFSRAWLMISTIGVLLTLAGMTVVREAIRLGKIDISSLYEKHAKAAQVGGLTVFLLCFVVCGVLIGWCVVIARRASKRAA